MEKKKLRIFIIVIIYLNSLFIIVDAKEIKKPQAVVFVSFSMPESLLQEIISEADKYQMPVVIRGLINDSFKDTAMAVFALIKDQNRGGIAIDPKLFKRFNIKAVPATVVYSSSKFDIIYGNISLREGLAIIADRGELFHIAQEILSG